MLDLLGVSFVQEKVGLKLSYYLKLWNLIIFVTIKSFTDNKEKKTKTMKIYFRSTYLLF